jgi:hypothetical protein
MPPPRAANPAIALWLQFPRRLSRSAENQAAHATKHSRLSGGR